jgi:hypothetical protein
MASKIDGYFKMLLESQSKQSKIFLVKSEWKGSGRKLFSIRTYCPENEKSYCWWEPNNVSI